MTDDPGKIGTEPTNKSGPPFGVTPPPDDLPTPFRIGWVTAVDRARAWGVGCGFMVAISFVFAIVLVIWLIHHVSFN